MILQIEYNNNNNNINNNNNNNKIFIEHQSTICPWCFTLMKPVAIYSLYLTKMPHPKAVLCKQILHGLGNARQMRGRGGEVS